MKFHYTPTRTCLTISTFVSMLLLAGCGSSPAETQIANASEIIKKELRSPASFSLVSGKTVWSGTTKQGLPAHVVRIEYDAQNGFGAAIRDCKMVAYWDKDANTYTHLTPGAAQSCDVPGVMSEDQVIKMQIDDNFN